MQQRRFHSILSLIVGYTVLLYGLVIVGGTLVRQLHTHGHHDIDGLFGSLPLLIGLGYIYLANLLLRLKYNAWLVTCALSVGSFMLNLINVVSHHHNSHDMSWLRVVLPLLILAMLLASRRLYRVRSDMRSFKQAMRVSVVTLFVALVYGITGFSLLDNHDFHQELNLSAAAHQTIDQFGLTTKTVTPYTRRAVLFVDSLSAVSIAALIYTVLAFFQPIRMNLTRQNQQRELAEQLLKDYPSDIDDFFKIWPHDKHYFFAATNTAGLAYHVSRGVALVAGEPFGERKQFSKLLAAFGELCYVNDWTPAFIHVTSTNQKLYERLGYRLQKIGEEAVLQLAEWPEQQIGKSGKYFREIRNRFTKLGYSVEIVDPPHSEAVLRRLRDISDDWLKKPGRTERGFMLGYHDEVYLQQSTLALLRDEAQQIQGFMNVIPTFESGAVNYDLLRCSEHTPGNGNDYLLMGALDYFHERGYQLFNLGLSPLAGITKPDSDEKTLVDNALRLVYSNGDRLYSFSGLHRFKDKYKPEWQNRYIAYEGGVRNFSRILAALNRAMKVK